MCGIQTLLYFNKYLVNMEITLILLAERKYDSAQKVKAINRILVPTLILTIENIIELCPQLQVLNDLEFKPGIKVHTSWKAFLNTLLCQVPWSAKSIEF